MQRAKKIKVCLISSSGGHFEQLSTFANLPKQKYEIFVVTEKTQYNKKDKRIKYRLSQVNRKEFLMPVRMFWNGIKSLYILIKERPQVVISTGVLATIPMLVLAHWSKCIVIYFESFAKVNSATETGKLVARKKIADRFYVQWPTMLKIYPEAVYMGGVY